MIADEVASREVWEAMRQYKDMTQVVFGGDAQVQAGFRLK
jgi:hypothetical protein